MAVDFLAFGPHPDDAEIGCGGLLLKMKDLGHATGIVDMTRGDMGWGMTVFLWLFLTPFIVMGLAMLGGFVSALSGRTEMRIQDGQGVLYTGIGALGWRRRFNAQSVNEVRIDDRRWRDSDGDTRRTKQIVIEMVNGKAIRFGSMLRDDRMKFVAAAARKALQPWICHSVSSSQEEKFRGG